MLIDIRISPQKIDLEWMEWLVKNKIYFYYEKIFVKPSGKQIPDFIVLISFSFITTKIQTKL